MGKGIKNRLFANILEKSRNYNHLQNRVPPWFVYFCYGHVLLCLCFCHVWFHFDLVCYVYVLYVYVLLCYVLLCYVLLCYGLLCFVVLCLCFVMCKLCNVYVMFMYWILKTFSAGGPERNKE